MPEPTMSIADPADDLPRTLKRERAARERAAREQELAANREPAFTPREREREPEPPRPYPSSAPSWPARDDLVPAHVRAIDVPFLKLVGFFLKASVAAIPALIVMGALIVGAGKLLQLVAPQYRVAAVTIHLPWAGDMPPARTAEAAKSAPTPAAPAPAKK